MVDGLRISTSPYVPLLRIICAQIVLVHLVRDWVKTHLTEYREIMRCREDSGVSWYSIETPSILIMYLPDKTLIQTDIASRQTLLHTIPQIGWGLLGAARPLSPVWYSVGAIPSCMYLFPLLKYVFVIPSGPVNLFFISSSKGVLVTASSTYLKFIKSRKHLSTSNGRN